MSSLLWWVVAEALVLVPSALASSHTTGINTNNTSGTVSNSQITKIELFDPLKNQTLDGLLANLLQGLTALAIPVVTVMIVVGAYYMITSAGNPGRISKGKDFILWAVIGFAVLLLATSITTIISNWIRDNQGP